MPSWNVNDQKIPQGRLALVSYVFVTIVVLLMVGFWKLQVVQSGHFADLAERNRVRSIPIIAPRGPMIDREGRVLVDSYPSFSILLMRDDPKSLEKSLPQIEDGLGIDHGDLRQALDATKSEPKFMPVIIKPAATQADIAFVESHRADIPVLELMMVQRRRYPHDSMLASAIGYVGEVSVQDMDQSDGHYRPGDLVGQGRLAVDVFAPVEDRVKILEQGHARGVGLHILPRPLQVRVRHAAQRVDEQRHVQVLGNGTDEGRFAGAGRTVETPASLPGNGSLPVPFFQGMPGPNLLD